MCTKHKPESKLSNAHANKCKVLGLYVNSPALFYFKDMFFQPNGSEIVAVKDKLTDHPRWREH